MNEPLRFVHVKELGGENGNRLPGAGVRGAWRRTRCARGRQPIAGSFVHREACREVGLKPKTSPETRVKRETVHDCA